MDSIELRELFQMIGEREVKIFQLNKEKLSLESHIHSLVAKYNEEQDRVKRLIAERDALRETKLEFEKIQNG